MMHNKTTLRKNQTGVHLANPAIAIVILLGLFAVCSVLTQVLASGLGRIIDDPIKHLRITMILQDLLMFVFPPIITSVIVTKLPARLLCIDSSPRLLPSMYAVLVWLASVPAMNAIVAWNAALNFPESMQPFEEQLRQMEENAQSMINLLMTGASIGSLIMSVLIIGVLAGFSEELFFRGGIQRIMMCSRQMNPHVAVWVTAVIFSLLHFQIFGFFPRMLLGAFFGYLLWWSGSLWLPIMIHILNNTVVTVMQWMQSNGHEGSDVAAHIGESPVSSGADLGAVVVSCVLTAVFMRALYKSCKQ